LRLYSRYTEIASVAARQKCLYILVFLWLLLFLPFLGEI